MQLEVAAVLDFCWRRRAGAVFVALVCAAWFSPAGKSDSTTVEKFGGLKEQQALVASSVGAKAQKDPGLDNCAGPVLASSVATTPTGGEWDASQTITWL